MNEKNVKNPEEEEKNSSETEIIYADKTTSVKARNHKKNERSKAKTQNISSSQANPTHVENMDEEDFKICLYITNKMSESVYAFSFRTPPDPTDEESASFIKATEKPMDFQTLTNNLTNNVYKTVADWRKDIVLIFENALSYYSPKLMAYESASKLKTKFWKLNNIFSKSEEEIWMNKIEKICSEYISAENDQ